MNNWEEEEKHQPFKTKKDTTSNTSSHNYRIDTLVLYTSQNQI